MRNRFTMGRAPDAIRFAGHPGLIVLLLVVAVLLFAAAKLLVGRVEAPSIAYSTLYERATENAVSRVTISGHHLTGVFRDGTVFRTSAPPDDIPALIATLVRDHVVVATGADEEPTHRSRLSRAESIMLVALITFAARYGRSRYKARVQGGIDRRRGRRGGGSRS